MNTYFDYYGSLFTQKQQEICRMYYYYDLSLSEIAEELGISRSGVYDAINKVQKDMDRYESLLHLVKNEEARLAMYEQIKEKTNDEAILSIVEQLESNDFSKKES